MTPYEEWIIDPLDALLFLYWFLVLCFQRIKCWLGFHGELTELRRLGISRIYKCRRCQREFEIGLWDMYPFI